jgi:Carboxypeptidase regulatory-like domain/TonB-dependent Receptor Plug Domain
MSRQIYAVCLKCLFSLVLLFSIGLPALGQSSSSAAVNGIVQDTTDARIPNASVKLINTDTGTESNSKTSKDGAFVIPSVLPGHYRLQIERDGFDTTQLTGITLNVGDNKQVIIRMKVGSPQQTVTVDGSGLTINTTDGSVSTVIDRKFIENMPLNGRSFQDLISMTPGVVTQSPQTATQVGGNGDFSVNGQRTESNYYIVDGVSGNLNAGNGYGIAQTGQSGTIASSTALGTTQSLISVDALQEFRVESSTYSAEYGRTPGGQFSFNTRSGTNKFHGTAFDYLRNNFFDANEWFNNYFGQPINALRQNDFGGTLGGPILLPFIHQGENKTFFFFSYEGLRLDQPQAATIQYVPDLFLRQQAAPSVQGIFNAFPIPNGIDYGTATSPNLAQFIQGYSTPAAIDATSIRIDQTATSKLKLFFRFSDTPSNTTSRILSALSRSQLSTQSYTFGLTSQISPRIVNDFRLGYGRSTSTVTSNLDSFGGAIPTDFAGAMGAAGYARPELGLELFITGIGSSTLEGLDSGNKSWQWNITDSTNLSLGRHQIKFGLDYRKIVSPTIPPSPTIQALFFSPQTAITGITDSLSLENSIATSPQFHQASVYIQDEWHVASRLSASFGARWEVDPPPTGADGNDAYTLLGNIANPSSLTLAPKGTPLWKTSWLNFAPRLGVAWTARATPGWETVVRTGGGVFFDSNAESAVYGFQAVGYVASESLSNAALPVLPAQLAFTPSAAPPYTNASIYAFPNHLQLPYTLEWNTSVEQALGKPQTLTVSYVGSNGRRLMQGQILSPPGFGAITIFESGVTSNYQALQAKLQRSVAHGVQALASYTWSHSIDFGSSASELPATRGNSDFDVRNNFQGGLSWDLPHSSTNRIVSSVIDGWGMDGRLIARSSFPITLLGNLAIDPGTGQYFYGGLNFNPGVPLYLRGCSAGVSCLPGGRAINPEAFSLPASGIVGDAPRNFARGFDATQINLAARREFHLSEAMTLQFRAEAFNILNHPNFGLVDPNYTDATFGQATQMLNQSLGTVSSLYQQGGSRSMQFALKLKF